MKKEEKEKRLLKEKCPFPVSEDTINDIKFNTNGMCTFIMDVIINYKKIYPQDTIDYLNKYEYFEFEISISRFWDDCDIDIEVLGCRYETDEELRLRIEDSEKRSRAAKKAAATKALKEKENKEKKDLEDYERLKKKFETKTK